MQKVYISLFFAKKIGKNIRKNISKNLNGKYSHKPLDRYLLYTDATQPLKTTSKKYIKKNEKQLVIWLVIKLLIELRKSQKGSPKNDSETTTNEHDEEIPKKDVSPLERQKIINDLRLT